MSDQTSPVLSSDGHFLRHDRFSVVVMIKYATVVERQCRLICQSDLLLPLTNDNGRSQYLRQSWIISISLTIMNYLSSRVNRHTSVLGQNVNVYGWHCVMLMRVVRYWWRRADKLVSMSCWSLDGWPDYVRPQLQPWLAPSSDHSKTLIPAVARPWLRP